MEVGEVVRVDGGVRVDLQGVNIISTTGENVMIINQSMHSKKDQFWGSVCVVCNEKLSENKNKENYIRDWDQSLSEDSCLTDFLLIGINLILNIMAGLNLHHCKVKDLEPHPEGPGYTWTAQQGPLYLSPVLEEPVVGIEHLVWEEVEPLPGHAPVVQPLLSLELHHQPLLHVFGS